MAMDIKARSMTMRRTFSFYVTATDAARIRQCGDIADAVVVAGASGPAVVRKLRLEGWSGTVLFDRVGYSSVSRTSNGASPQPDKPVFAPTLVDDRRGRAGVKSPGARAPVERTALRGSKPRR